MKYPSIVLIVADALRFDRLGCYGNKKGLTPNIDKLASEGILFKRCYSSSTWTFPAVASLFTSYLPDVHLLKEVVPDESGMLTSDVLAPSFLTLAEILKNNGFETLSVVANPWLRDFFQVTRGFKKRIYEKKVDAKRINELFFSNIFKGKDFPTFYYLHYMDCHAPFNLRLSDSLRKKYKDLIDKLEFPLKYKHFKRNFNSLSRKEIEFLNDVYEGEVRYLDSFLGEIFKYFKDSIIIFTSDHGEFLGERDYHPLIKDRVIAFGHNKTPYEELIRVPLIIKIPEFKGREVEKIVHHIDIMPTIVEYLEISLEEKFQGKSILPFIKGKKVNDSYFDVAISIKHEGRFIPFVERSVVVKNEKLIQYLSPEREQIIPFDEGSFNSINYNFGGYFTLLGYVINKKSFKRGEYGWIKLYIKCERKIHHKNTFFIILFVEEKSLTVPFIEKHYPVFGLRHPKDWEEGEIIEDLFTFYIPPYIKKGNYYLKIGLYNVEVEKIEEDAERNFLGGGKIFGKIKIDENYMEVKDLKVNRNIFKKAFFSLFSYLASFSILNMRKTYKKGDVLFLRCRWKRFFKWEINYIHFKFFKCLSFFRSYGPLVFIGNKGFVKELEGKGGWKIFDDVFPILIPPYLTDGRYRLKSILLPKIFRKKKWDFFYFKVEDINVSGENTNVIEKYILFCGVNLKNFFFERGKKVVGELILKFLDVCEKSLNFSFLMVNDDKVVFKKEFVFDVSIKDIPYYGFVIKSFPFEFDIPNEIKGGSYEFNVVLEGKDIKCYKMVILSDIPKLEVLREEFYDLDVGEMKGKNIVAKIGEEKIEKFRNILDETYNQSFLLRKSKLDSDLGERNFVQEEIIKELKDLGYF